MWRLPQGLPLSPLPGLSVVLGSQSRLPCVGSIIRPPDMRERIYVVLHINTRELG
jgi:hypothetical protein